MFMRYRFGVTLDSKHILSFSVHLESSCPVLA